MAATSEKTIKKFNFNASNRAIREIFNEESTDISFSFPNAGKQKIDAHKTLLSALSPVFKAMFSGNWKESTQVEILDAHFDEFNEFAQYFYTDEITVSTKNVGELLYLAKKYEIPDLVSACSSFLMEHESLDNMVNCLSLACTFELDALKVKCKKIICSNTTKVVESEAFIHCDKNALFEILSIDSSSCPEEKVFDACIKWAEHKCAERKIEKNGENLRCMLGNCFDSIRFKEIPIADFNKRLILYKDMFTKDEIIAFMDTHVHNRFNPRREPYVIVRFGRLLNPQQTQKIHTRFKLSKNIRLNLLSFPKNVWQLLYEEQGRNVDRCSITIKTGDSRDSYSTLESEKQYWVRPAPLYGIDCFEFETSPILTAKMWFSIDISYNYSSNIVFPLFNAKNQTIQNVSLSLDSYYHGNSTSANDATHFSALHFEECDSST